MLRVITRFSVQLVDRKGGNYDSLRLVGIRTSRQSFSALNAPQFNTLTYFGFVDYYLHFAIYYEYFGEWQAFTM